MNQKISFSESSTFKTLNREQINQILDAILAGKYSWACFLLLRCMSYDPSHYISYRTYNRLVKEHYQVGKPNELNTERLQTSSKVFELSVGDTHGSEQRSQITDLEYLEESEREKTSIKGGSTERSPELNSVRFNPILQIL